MTGGSYLGFERVPDFAVPSTAAGKWSIEDIYASRLENEWPEYKVPIEYVVVAGGGGSAGSRDNVQISGGGGGGGYRASVWNEQSGGLSDPEDPYLVTAGNSFTVTVGAGGSAGSAAGDGVWGGMGTNGTNSVLGPITALGGGRGGQGQSTGTAGDGGSGGGGGIGNKSGGSATDPNQGFFGGPAAGYGLLTETDVWGGTGSGGGGGAGGPGQPGLAVGSQALAGRLGQLVETPVDAASTEYINRFDPPSSIDGVTLTDGMRVLIKDQDIKTQNGIYVYDATLNTLNTRSAEMNGNNEIDPGTWVSVSGGVINAGTNWGIETRQNTNDGLFGTTEIVFIQNSKMPPSGGAGGPGIISGITGSNLGRGGGGGGGASGGPTRAGDGVTSRTSSGGVGTHGGATAGTPANNNGTGGYATGNSNGVSAAANRGGGAGGSAFMVNTSGGVAGGAGGSGIVILRYPVEYSNLTVGAGLTYSGPTTVGSYKVYQFTAGSGTVTFNG